MTSVARRSEPAEEGDPRIRASRPRETGTAPARRASSGCRRGQVREADEGRSEDAVAGADGQRRSPAGAVPGQRRSRSALSTAAGMHPISTGPCQPHRAFGVIVLSY